MPHGQHVDPQHGDDRLLDPGHSSDQSLHHRGQPARVKQGLEHGRVLPGDTAHSLDSIDWTFGMGLGIVLLLM